MTSDDQPRFAASQLSSSDQQQLDQLCSQFEQELRDGNRPSPADYARDVSETLKEVLLHELSMLASDYRRHGPSLTVDVPDPEASTILVSAPPKVIGSYEVLEKLGEGGMGCVYKARHVRLQSLAAIKLLAGPLRILA